MKVRSLAQAKNKLSQNIDDYIKNAYIQFHSPAHNGFANPRDLSEVETLDDLAAATGVLKEYQELTAKVFQAQKSFFLVNGASIGLQAACLALKIYLEKQKDSRPVLIARNIHKSVFSGLILAGFDCVWLEPDWHESLGIYTRINFTKELCQEIEVKYSALIITNPSYEGFYSKLEKLSIPVIVDEAHGAHFQFSDKLPKPALACGADLVVQSWHKTLGSLTQTGVLHVNHNSKIPTSYVEAGVKLLQTTSPSYLLLESLCQVACDYDAEGDSIVAEAIEKANAIQKYRVSNDDPLRCLLAVPGYSGIELDEILFAKKISLEQVLTTSVLAFINPAHSKEDVKALMQTLSDLELRKENRVSIEKPKVKTTMFRPRTTFFEEGQINIVAPCPPGIIKSYPGENN